MLRVERGIRATKQANGVRLNGWEQHRFVSSLPFPYASVHISFSPAFDPFPPFRSFAFPFLSSALSQVLLLLSRGASKRCKQARGAFGFDRRRSVLPQFSSVGISATMHRLSLSFFPLLPSCFVSFIRTFGSNRSITSLPVVCPSFRPRVWHSMSSLPPLRGRLSILDG